MKLVDFAVGWPVEDKSELFLNALRAECKVRGLSFAIICGKSLEQLTYQVKKGKLKIKFFLDMASETFDSADPFTKFVYTLKDAGTFVVADPDLVKFSADKSIAHFSLLQMKIPVPYTVVIRNWEAQRRLTRTEKKNLGLPFVVKPALGYGQKGVKVIRERFSLKEIAYARQFSPGDNFLLQEFIEPPLLGGNLAWFRVFYLFDEVFPCWWNPQTNIFRRVTLREFDLYKLMPLVRISCEIARITGIKWFSCEIAINKRNKKFVVIDYMNDQCSIYPQSLHKDGIPDDLIVLISRRMTVKAWEYIMETFMLSNRAVWFPKMNLTEEGA